jgi:hypothetical protein
MDSNFGLFVANNGLGLEVDENNEIVRTTKFDSKHKATILAQLDYRYASSKSIKDLCENLLKITNNLIQEIENYLE